jgi:hypothetical protein
MNAVMFTKKYQEALSFTTNSQILIPSSAIQVDKTCRKLYRT